MTKRVESLVLKIVHTNEQADKFLVHNQKQSTYKSDSLIF